MKTLRFFTAITLLLLPLSSVFSQTDSSGTIRLKKYERIYLAAYDDTTRALATLFLAKRQQIIGPHTTSEIERYIGLNMKTNWIVFGVSSVVLVTGLVMAGNAPPSEGQEDISFLIPLLGAMGMIASGINLGAQYILLTPYTVKKYFRLVEKYQAEGQLPPYYAKRIRKYLR
ncbi:MAG: hypothetical protein HRU69_08575 [Flammeovirgaceae bacterium]|nr:MAG: hypothetical protein HRU69_08575 [Flammeovirgaceae bacterium]